MNLLAILLAAGIPAIFLLIIYTQDLYASRTFRLVLLCFAWGAFGGVGLAFLFNSYVAYPTIMKHGWNILLLYVLFAPIAEELTKSLGLLYVSRRPEFTYFVDGAIYGFASGIGFSIVENFIYLSRNPRMGVAMAVSRAFSTCLMHGTAAGLVGVAIGRVRFQQRGGKSLGLLGGWLAAMTLHAAFNGVVQSGVLSLTLESIVPIGIGFAGVGLIAYVIALGLREQKQWLADTLDRKVGVSGAEMRAAQAYSSLEELLEPITRQFPQKTEQVMNLVLRQAQLGIRRKVQEKLTDPKQKEQLAQEIAQMQAEMEQLRKAIGPYVMTYVRAVFPEGALNVWARLEAIAAQTGPADTQKWARMLTAPKRDATTPPSRSIFGQVQAQTAKMGDEAPQ
ncbi:MAG TPA: PrsW family glutamic-type intramembrane protease [Anaerolineae bacterium]|nr:PrsW family glutamic-type intramembrane protease [Anaerolineae bacterium]HQK12792.1 PrsW family glutamic-type intramembrane protease [Anaerolineae bacterium]